MRERLIELLMNTPKPQITIGGRAQGKTYQTAGNIADHLLENGVLAPPCKVGDIVYFVGVDENCEDYIDKGKVYAISQDENTLWFSVRYLSGLRYDHPARNIGKTVFLTKEEAEKALGKDKDVLSKNEEVKER